MRDLALSIGCMSWSTNLISVIPRSLVMLHISSATLEMTLVVCPFSVFTKLAKDLSSPKHQGKLSVAAAAVAAGLRCYNKILQFCGTIMASKIQ